MSVLSHRSAATTILGGNGKTITYNHLLVDGDGNPLIPDVVDCQVSAFAAAQPPIITETSRSASTVVWTWQNALAGDTLTVVCRAQANVSNQGDQGLVAVGAVVGSGGQGAPIVSPNVNGGTATVLAGTGSIVVNDAAITNNSSVVATIDQTLADATMLEVVRVDVNPGSFTVFGNANATANVKVNFIIFY